MNSSLVRQPQANFIVLFLVLQVTVCAQVLFGQQIASSFKIVGRSKVKVYPASKEYRQVESDPKSADHLFISYINGSGLVISKSQFLFKGKRFNLENLLNYNPTTELILDGIQTNYRNDGTIMDERIIQNGKLQEKTVFYPDGKKQLTVFGDENILNGVYKSWHPNGELSFSGTYRNNSKEGEFLLFDQSGAIIRKGKYQSGSLVSGDVVIQDIIYKNPDKLPQYIEGDENLAEYLEGKSKETEGLKNIPEENNIRIKLIIDKTGKVLRTEELSFVSAVEHDYLKALFKEFPAFTPALVENTPVASELKLDLTLSSNGVKLIQEKPSNVFYNVDQMPEFPGGLTGLRQFIALNIRYPIEAVTARIKGKVLVNFVISEEGEVTNISVLKSVHSLLDNEAVRVVRMMPKWEPGRMNGKPVKVSYIVPVTFQLRNDNNLAPEYMFIGDRAIRIN